MAITAADVRNLRDKTGAPMMDCKKALEATGGDMEAAEDHLRKLGLKAAGKKAGRATGEGRCFFKVTDDGKRGAMVAVACETDFVAATADYNAFLEALCDHVLEHRSNCAETILAEPWAGGGTVQDALTETIGKLGENMTIANVKFIAEDQGFVGGYIHHNNKVGVLAGIQTGADREKTEAMLKQLGMHAAALPPTALKREDVDAELIEREKAIYREEVKGKPEDIQDKIIAGKLNKFFADTCLREQPWVMDDKISVEKAVEQGLGKGSVINDYARFAIGA
ncbi:MAG: elongation factor Ts [Planctomycetes bacterium]|nr:elongation factor Ts [Planctomycetota bacterium]